MLLLQSLIYLLFLMMTPYNILLLGSGGREHAMATHIAQSPLCNHLYIAPGNAGTTAVGTNLPLSPNDFVAVKQCIIEHDIHLVVIGPEDPLVNGLTDMIHADGDLQDVLVFGPCAAGARLEGSKAFAKTFMEKYNIPTASYREFSAAESSLAKEYVSRHPLPIVIKADGLAAGKGVIIAGTHQEAISSIDLIFGGQFGDAGSRIVIESFLDGVEFSVFVATDGERYFILPVAKDYKKIYENDQGPNTGGMGAVSPVPFVDDYMMQQVEENIIKPTLYGLRQENIPYTGFIFFGLIAVDGRPMVIEYNVRMGDPETEVVFPRIKGDMVSLMKDLILKRNFTTPEIDPDFTAGIYIVSHGYPGSYEKGKEIGLDDLPDYCSAFHGGTALTEDGTIVSNGGRVIFVYAGDSNLTAARTKALAGADAVKMENKFYRRDIGKDVDK